MLCASRSITPEDDGRIEHRAFLGAVSALAQRCSNLDRQAHARLRSGKPMGHLLVADVDHRGSVVCIQVRKTTRCRANGS